MISLNYLFEKENEKYINVTIPNHLREKMKGVSLKKDKDGYFVTTHRCRSDSYESPDKIPDYKIKRIASTG